MSSSTPRLDPWGDIEPDVSSIVTEDDTPVDNLFSEKQQRLLTEALYASWAGPPPGEDGAPRPFLATANVGLFASPKQPPLVPDAMVSVDVQAHPDLWAKQHRSYFVWEFGKPPEVVIEVVSNREGDELGAKRRRYASMRVWLYVVWDPERVLSDERLRCFELRGQFYTETRETWFAELGIGLKLWAGSYEGVEAEWLRWCDAQGRVLPTGAERAAEAQQRAEEERTRAAEAQQRAEEERTRAERERSRADHERERAERLAARLRALGIDPDAG